MFSLDFGGEVLLVYVVVWVVVGVFVAVAAAQAVERVGMPESQIILSQAVTYMACAPKSNSAVNAIFAAM